jgi:hypothetical protein
VSFWGLGIRACSLCVALPNFPVASIWALLTRPTAAAAAIAAVEGQWAWAGGLPWSYTNWQASSRGCICQNPCQHLLLCPSPQSADQPLLHRFQTPHPIPVPHLTASQLLQPPADPLHHQRATTTGKQARQLRQPGLPRNLDIQCQGGL